MTSTMQLTQLQLTTTASLRDGWDLTLDLNRELYFPTSFPNRRLYFGMGPMGVFEMSNFANGTNEIAKSVVKATDDGGFSLIGGGDSAAAVNNLGYGDQVSYVSTGGGALLEYMEGKVLPGVAALED